MSTPASSPSPSSPAGPSPRLGASSSNKTGIDPRGPRFGAGITAVLLAVAFLTGSVWVLAVAVVLFALGTLLGVRRSPYGLLFARLIRPRLSPPVELEDPAPPRFAQTVGLFVTGLGLILAVAGVDGAVEVSAAVGFVAAFLNSVFDYCLGCEMYLLLARLRAA